MYKLNFNNNIFIILQIFKKLTRTFNNNLDKVINIKYSKYFIRKILKKFN